MLERTSRARSGRRRRYAASERDDPRVGRGAGRDRQAVRPGARAGHERRARRSSLRVLDADASIALADRQHLARGRDRAARLDDVFGEATRDPRGSRPSRSRGEWSAATPWACGSTSRISSPPSRRRPGTPFALPRRSSSSSRGSSSGRSRRSACRRAGPGSRARRRTRRAHARPRRRAAPSASRARSRCPAWITPLELPGLVRRDLRLALEHGDPDAVVAQRQLARGREAHDPGSDRRRRRIARLDMGFRACIAAMILDDSTDMANRRATIVVGHADMATTRAPGTIFRTVTNDAPPDRRLRWRRLLDGERATRCWTTTCSALTGVARPRVCFLPTASGDADDYVVRFYQEFARSPRRGVAPRALPAPPRRSPTCASTCSPRT